MLYINSRDFSLFRDYTCTNSKKNISMTLYQLYTRVSNLNGITKQVIIKKIPLCVILICKYPHI